MKEFKETGPVLSQSGQAKKEIIRHIGVFAKRGTFSKEDIAFFLLKELGASNKFVINYIDECVTRGIFKEEKGLISLGEIS